jgi:hypothetical protein
MKTWMILMCAIVAGCAGFDPAPENVPSMMSDAAMPATDAATTDSGHAHSDGGMEMPREVDSGMPIGDRPESGDLCDYGRDAEIYPGCALDGCDHAYLVCLPTGAWRCVPDTGALCEMPHPETDAGMPATDAGSPAVDAGHDAGTRDAGTDAGTRDAGHDAGPVVVVDAGRTDSCRPEIVAICLRDPACGALGYRLCNTTSGIYDGECLHFVGQDCPAPVTDAGTPAVDAGPRDAGRDLGTDAGPRDAGTDAGRDLGTDAGPPPVVDAGTDAGSSTLTLEILFGVDATALPRPVAELSLREEIATASSTRSELQLLDCDPATRGMVTESGLSYYRCRVTRSVDASLSFVGRIDFTDGSVWHSVSGWGRTNCDNPATPDRIESATPGMRWIVRTLAGASRLPPSGIPTVAPLYSITEDTFPVCRHSLTFTRP